VAVSRLASTYGSQPLSERGISVVAAASSFFTAASDAAACRIDRNHYAVRRDIRITINVREKLW
jgi:hypothetical protein